MKAILTALFILFSVVITAQTDSLKSNVYAWNNLKVEKNNGNERRNILEGTTTHLEYLEIHVTTLSPGKAPHPPHKHLDTEELIIIKEGTLKITIGDSTKILGPGSIAVAMPGDEHGFVNTGKTPATYYVIKYRSKAPLNSERATKAGGSYMINWNDVVFKERPKGGSRQFFERPTGMLNRFEMHVTTLNEGLKSHEPHTHVAEEMMIILSGEVEMQIGDAFYKGVAGDLYLVKSGVLHAPRNAGKGPCMYYAIQFH